MIEEQDRDRIKGIFVHFEKGIEKDKNAEIWEALQVVVNYKHKKQYSKQVSIILIDKKVEKTNQIQICSLESDVNWIENLKNADKIEGQIFNEDRIVALHNKSFSEKSELLVSSCKRVYQLILSFNREYIQLKFIAEDMMEHSGAEFAFPDDAEMIAWMMKK